MNDAIASQCDELRRHSLRPQHTRHRFRRLFVVFIISFTRVTLLQKNSAYCSSTLIGDGCDFARVVNERFKLLCLNVEINIA
jgi:hypothetical protein